MPDPLETGPGAMPTSSWTCRPQLVPHAHADVGTAPRAVIHIIGIGADGTAGLRPDLIELIDSADFLAGGERHLRYFPSAAGQRFTIKDNLDDLAKELRQRFRSQQCVVLASGDPLFYGIGAYLLDAFSPEQLHIEPAISSMQLAFARVGAAWQEAALASIHGRDLRITLLPLLGHSLIGLFTADGNSPSAVARFFAQHGLNDYEAIICENLGAADERITRLPNLTELMKLTCSPLNYLVLRRPGSQESARIAISLLRSLAPGIPDEKFYRPDDGREVMTRQEVRSVAIGKLMVPTEPGDVAWDIGAGLGTISVELAVLRPHLEVVAVERDRERSEFLHRNRQRFGAHNIRLLAGEAPNILSTETERPCMIFLGGSGTHLPAILDFCKDKLQDGGRLVANFVTLENLMQTLQRLQEWQWPFEVTEIHVSRSDSLAGLTGMKPQRGVFIVAADKPLSDT